MKIFQKALLTLSSLTLISLTTSTQLLAEEIHLFEESNVSSEVNSTSELKNDGTFVIGTWTPDTKSGTIGDYELQGNGMIGVAIGKSNLFTENIGGYIGFEKSYNTVGEDGRSNEVMYAYTIYNAGLTFSPTKSLTVMAGVGYSQESAEYADNGNYFVTIEDNEQINYNFEVSYNITKEYGIVAGYNTAPEAYNVGVKVVF